MPNRNRHNHVSTPEKAGDTGLLAVGSLWAIGLSVFAQTTKLGPPVTQIGFTISDFVDLLIRIIQAILMPVVVICLIYGGYLLLTSGDNDAKRTTAKSWIFWSIVGTAIILGARVIAEMVKNTAGSL